MSLKHLRTLVAIAEHRTFSAAAQQICLTHAAVSQHMAALEAEMGVALFDRSTRTPRLNATGLALVGKARAMIRDYDGLIPSILGADTLTGDFRLGAVPTTLATLAPRGINALKTACPDLRLFLRPGLTRDLVHMLEQHGIDAALMTEPATRPKGLAFHALASEPLMLIASEHVPGNDPVHLLTTRPFIRFNRDATVGAQIDDWLRHHAVEVSEAMELDTLDAIAAMVQADIGVSIVPCPCAPLETPLRLRWLPLSDPAPSRTLGIGYREDTTKSLVIEKVCAAFESALGGQS